MTIRRIAFVLLDGYALLSTAAALEPLRAANMFSTPPRYDITLLSQSQTTAPASIGARFDTRPFRQSAPDFDLIFVVAGGAPEQVTDPALFAWLRRADLAGVALGGISGGSVILAKAGLLRHRRFTVHWHHYDHFANDSGSKLLERRLFVIDRNRYTCAGGSAPLDMMYAIIARDHGTSFAQKISDWFIQTEIRGSDAPQRASITARYGPLPHSVEAALNLMETHIADPLDQAQIAQLSGLSARQLQRQFHSALGETIMQAYRRIRVETGRDLLIKSHLPVSEISLMTGFASPAHFSDSFRRIMGQSPLAWRKQTGPDNTGPAA